MDVDSRPPLDHSTSRYVFVVTQACAVINRYGRVCARGPRRPWRELGPGGLQPPRDFREAPIDSRVASGRRSLQACRELARRHPPAKSGAQSAVCRSVLLAREELARSTGARVHGGRRALVHDESHLPAGAAGFSEPATEPVFTSAQSRLIVHRSSAAQFLVACRLLRPTDPGARMRLAPGFRSLQTYPSMRLRAQIRTITCTY